MIAIAGVPPPGVVPPGGVPDPEVPDSGDGGSGNDNDNPTPTTSNTDPASSTTSSSSATSSSSTDGPIVTAIADFEYPDIRQLQAIMIDPSGPLPEDDSGSVTITATSPSDTSSTAQPTTTTKSTTTPSTANVLCQDDCTAIIPQLSVYGDLICSSDDFDKFLDHGTTSDPNGNADWFRISSHEDCYLVMAKSAVHRGFPDQYCFRKDAIIDFVNQNALGCKFGDGFLRKSGAQQAQSKTSGNGELCLANFKNYQSCGETSV